MPRKPPATANACGRKKSCRRNSLGRLLSWLLRVTNMPAASEIRNAGTCVTRPSPMVSVVNSEPASLRLMPFWTMPMNSPPMMLISMITMPGDGVAADELAGAVHGAEEVGLLRDLPAAALGFLLVDHAGVQVGVDGHLLAGHSVEGEPGGHFADARGALGDDDELDQDDDREDDQADDDVVGPGGPAGDEPPKVQHDAAGRPLAVGCPPG